MSDESKQNLPVEAAPVALPATKPKRRPRKRFNLELTYALRKNQFEPVNFLIKQVIPQLDPKDQAHIIMDLLKYIYPTYKARDAEPGKPSSKSPITNNITIGGGATKVKEVGPKALTIEQLERLASLPDEEDDK